MPSSFRDFEFAVFHSPGKCMNRVIEALREYATNGTAENFRLP